MDQPPVTTHKSRKKLWFIAVGLVIGALLVYALFFTDFILNLVYPDRGVGVGRDGTVADEQYPYTVRLQSDWQVFERIYHSERASLTAEEIRELISTCGQSCAATGVIKMGDFPSTACETAECLEMELGPQEGASLTVYVFGNPDNLTLDEFIALALSKSVWADNYSDVTTPQGYIAKREVATFGDGRELSSLYIANDQLVYWLDQDVISTDPASYTDVAEALSAAVDSFELQ